MHLPGHEQMEGEAWCMKGKQMHSESEGSVGGSTVGRQTWATGVWRFGATSSFIRQGRAGADAGIMAESRPGCLGSEAEEAGG